jgi:demethylmenaquinone methyltransferase/2-methoxy-6-polyprenyl-1,4-benzoquinol methylase
MRTALSIETLKQTYKTVSKHYDLQHALLTARSDQRGRKLLINKTAQEGLKILDCGAGTGSTGIMAVRKVGPKGHVTFFDLSDDMLDMAREKVKAEHVEDRVDFQTGDMAKLPFADNQFDVVYSTYSLCPLTNPAKGALELYRVTKPGGKIAIAHSCDPSNKLIKMAADSVENIAWHFPWLSMGCRSVSVLPALKKAGGKVIFSKHIGVPLWPFVVFIVEKPI